MAAQETVSSAGAGRASEWGWRRLFVLRGAKVHHRRAHTSAAGRAVAAKCAGTEIDVSNAASVVSIASELYEPDDGGNEC